MFLVPIDSAKWGYISSDDIRLIKPDMNVMAGYELGCGSAEILVQNVANLASNWWWEFIR
jgi:hypothetical protein